MAKRLVLLGIAVVSFAIPAVAAASPELRDASGKVAVGAVITGTSTNAAATLTAFGPLKCSHFVLKGEVTSNTGTHIAVKGTGGHTATCFAGPEALTVTDQSLLFMTTSSEDEGAMSLTFTADVGPFECHFMGLDEFTYETGSSNDTIHVSGGLSTSEFCTLFDDTGVPYEPIFEADFTLTTESNGQPVFIQ
ncbi:MAG TPA: hypothetical protein VEB65_00915 [Solirubrobacterales bacterium]|nr:hypothetical protein [Solirubrobacterales bacterium]